MQATRAIAAPCLLKDGSAIDSRVLLIVPCPNLELGRPVLTRVGLARVRDSVALSCGLAQEASRARTSSRGVSATCTCALPTAWFLRGAAGTVAALRVVAALCIVTAVCLVRLFLVALVAL